MGNQHCRPLVNLKRRQQQGLLAKIVCTVLYCIAIFLALCTADTALEYSFATDILHPMHVRLTCGIDVLGVWGHTVCCHAFLISCLVD